MTTTWWFEITEGDNEGEEFFVEIEGTLDHAKQNAAIRAQEIFPTETLHCLGRVSQTEAEIMGLDTY